MKTYKHCTHKNTTKYRKITNSEKRTNTVRFNQKETYQTPYRNGTANQAIESWQQQTTKILRGMYYAGVFEHAEKCEIKNI